METTGQQLVDHWNSAAEKGLMNKNTASGRRWACVQVLSILPDWQNVDVSQLNVEDILLRFQNLKKKDFRPNVVEVYKKRFKVALDSYLEYFRDPGNWRESSQERQAAPRPVISKLRQSGRPPVYNGRIGCRSFERCYHVCRNDRI